MKLILAVLLGCVAYAAAGVYQRHHYHHHHGLKNVGDGYSAGYDNAARQLYVNHVAEHKGAGVGTSDYVGVPGTNNVVVNKAGFYGHHGYHHGHHGYGVVGYDGKDVGAKVHLPDAGHHYYPHGHHYGHHYGHYPHHNYYGYGW